MSRISLLGGLAAALVIVAVPAAAQPAAQPAAANAQLRTKAAKIANAMRAGPREIARNATIMDWPASPGQGLVLLREGSNEWTCLPDDPNTRGNDPMCLDRVWQRVISSVVAGQEPEVTGVGYAYMLTTDAEVSNVDPMARERTKDNQWHHVGPHVMMIYPDARLLEGLPTEPRAGEPYVMWAGTKLAHIMWPTATGYLERPQIRRERPRTPATTPAATPAKP